MSEQAHQIIAEFIPTILEGMGHDLDNVIDLRRVCMDYADAIVELMVDDGLFVENDGVCIPADLARQLRDILG